MKWWLLGVLITINDVVNSMANSDFARQTRVLTEPETVEDEISF